MALYQVTEASLVKVPETTFAQEKVFERRDLQRLLRLDPSVIASDLYVIAEEYGDWEDSGRRIDLLCLSKEAQLVVVELKRTEDGGHMELQAIRYAAMVSSMTFDQLVSAHARLIGGDDAHQRAEASICEYLGWKTSEDGSLSSDDVRIILIAADFSREVTTAVLWLNKRDLDITCIRIKPYKSNGQLLIDVQQIIPLPEAAEYETKIRDKKQEERRVKSKRQEIFWRFWGQLIERSKGKTTVVEKRNSTTDHWLSGGIGRSAFVLNFVMRQEDCQVECFIDIGKGAEEANVQVFKELEAQKAEIEAAFGEALDWQELSESRGCRICKVMLGGWKSPEAEWPNLQDKMIDAMVRLERALKGPVHAIKLPGES